MAALTWKEMGEKGRGGDMGRDNVLVRVPLLWKDTMTMVTLLRDWLTVSELQSSIIMVGKHGGVQEDMVLEMSLRVLHLDLKAA